ncbi:MAG: glycosyltransferase family 4 protein, partial [Cyanobacteria bacterium J06638_6]
QTDGVINCGVPERPARPSLASPPTVVFAGRLVWEKGIDVLVRAFVQVKAHCPEAQLMIAGDGPERDRINHQIEQLGLSESITLPGHLPRSEMEEHFNQAWVQVVPSRWAEPFGMVAAEGMMRGTAVVASASGGLLEVVQNGETGLLVPPGAVDALAQALLTILGDRALAEKMGQAGRKIALARYSEAVFVDQFIHQYETLLGKPALIDRRQAHVV